METTFETVDNTRGTKLNEKDVSVAISANNCIIRGSDKKF